MVIFKKPIWIVLTVFFVAYFFLILRLHFNYSTTDSDLAIYDQQIWFLSHFKLANSSFKDGFNAFGDHFGLIEVLIAPIYWLWDSVVVLLLLQVVSIILSAWPLYLTVKKSLKISELWSALFITVYLLYFGFQSADIFPFHLATLSVGLVAWTIYAVLEEKWLLYWPLLFLTLITKEDLPLFGIVLGVLLMVRKKFLIGSVTFGLSLFYFYLVTYFIIPVFAQRKYSYFVSDLGNSPVEIIINSVLNPIKAVLYLVTPLVKLRTITAMFASFGFLTLLSPTFLFLLSPFIASRFLNDTLQRHLPWMHYSANQGPLLAFGAIFGLLNLSLWLRKWDLFKPFQKWLVPVAITGALFLTLIVGKIYQMPLIKLLDINFYYENPGAKNIRAALTLIPKQASVATQSGLQPHLSHRDQIMIYPDPSQAVDNRYEDLPPDALPEEYKLPKTDYLLISVDAFHWRPEGREEFMRQIDYVKTQNDWLLVFDKEGTALFKKKL